MKTDTKNTKMPAFSTSRSSWTGLRGGLMQHRGGRGRGVMLGVVKNARQQRQVSSEATKEGAESRVGLKGHTACKQCSTLCGVRAGTHQMYVKLFFLKQRAIQMETPREMTRNATPT